jgi:hypothetical protein
MFGISNERNHAIHDWLKKIKLIERERKVKIQIDPWDTWNADCTMAAINAQILKQFRKSECLGHPSNLDPEDYPAELDEINGWLYIIDEMIYAFDCYEYMFDYTDMNEYQAIKARFDTGLKLYCKYYTSLWD